MEAVLTLPVLVLGAILAIEVARRAYFELAFHHFAFLSVREAAFRSSSSNARIFLERALGRNVAQAHDGNALGEGGGFRFRAHYRYAAFANFPWKRGRKHHFEVVRECQFPLSSD